MRYVHNAHQNAILIACKILLHIICNDMDISQ